MDIEIRKKDLEHRLELLKREAASTVDMVNLLFKSCEELVNNVCNEDRTNFVLRFPSVVKDLDTRFYHLLQFNCSLDIDLDINKSAITTETSEDIRGDTCRSRPTPNPITEPGLALEGVGLDEAVIGLDVGLDEYEEDSQLYQQSSACMNLVPISAKSHNNESFVVEGAKEASLNTTSNVTSTKSENVLKSSQDLDNRLQESSSHTFQSKLQCATNQIDKLPVAIGSVIENENCAILITKQPNCVSVPLVVSGSMGLPPASKKTPYTKNNMFVESVNRPVHVEEERAVMLSHIETPGEFYVHIVCKENASLDEFHKELNTFYVKNKVTLKSKSAAKKRIGNFCACFQSELGWCRAQVLDWCMEEDTIHVQLVDYGDVCIVTLSMLQPLTPLFFQQPLYATRCHLAFIQPPSQNDSWPPESARVFTCYMPTTNKIKAKQSQSIDDEPRVYTIIKAEEDNLMPNLSENNNLAHQISLPVILSDSGDLNKLIMNDILIELGYADTPIVEQLNDATVSQNDKFIDQNISEVPDQMQNVMEWLSNSSDPERKPDRNAKQQSLIKNYSSNSHIDEQTSSADMSENMLEDWNPMQEDFLDPSASRENAVLAVSGYDAQDETRICRFYARNGHCYKGNNCRKEHSFIHEDGYTTDKELVYTQSFNPFCMPAEGSKIIIKVTHVPENQKYFYCIIPPVEPCSQTVIEEETLFSLTKHINDPKVVKTYAHLKVPPAPGQIVLAFSNADTSWHRARVVEDPYNDSDDDTIKVIFVDSGITETISENNVRAIAPSLLHFPFQAVECYLANVEFDKHDSVTCAKYFRDLYQHKTLTAKVITSLEESQILHCVLFDCSGRDVGSLLVQAGYGSQKNWSSRLLLMPA